MIIMGSRIQNRNRNFVPVLDQCVRLSGDKHPEIHRFFDVRSIHVQDLQKAGERKSFMEKIVYVDTLDGSVTIFHCLG